MAFKDILVALTSYPRANCQWPWSRTRLRLLRTSVPTLQHFMRDSRSLPGHFLSASVVNGIITGETGKSRKNAHELLAAFDAAAENPASCTKRFLEKCITLDVPDILVEYARLRDLTILSVPVSYDQWYAEAIIFCSGQANPDPAGASATPAVRTQHGCGRVGFQPCGGPGDIRCAADSGIGEEGSHRNGRQREGAGHQAFCRRGGQESGPARHRRRARQDRCRRQFDRRGSRTYTSSAWRRFAGNGACWHSPAAGIRPGGATHSFCPARRC